MGYAASLNKPATEIGKPPSDKGVNLGVEATANTRPRPVLQGRFPFPNGRHRDGVERTGFVADEFL